MNNYVKKDSPIHRLNPLVKVIFFLLIAILTFLRNDFLIQILLLVAIGFAYFLAKLSFKNFYLLIFVYIFMFSIIFFINWVTQKTPLFVNQTDLALARILPVNSQIQLDNNHVWTGKIYGGFVVSDLDQNFPLIFKGNTNQIENIIKTYITENKILERFPGFTLDELRINNIARNESIGFFIKSYGLTEYAWLSSFYVANKLFIVIISSAILTSATSTIELTYAFENLLRPLKLLRLPVNEIAMIISISLRFIPSLISESFRIMNAQASRGIDFKNGNFIEKIQSLISLIVPLFTIAFIKADDLANAMTARSYNPRYRRSRYRIFVVDFKELIIFGIIIIFFTISYYLTVHKFVFDSFGSSDYLIVLGH
ncbi:Energy-coupling factor transporter transmembrane component T [[Mycoplasma] cavipharyngis]|uniref:energy-coupling factor transporter transmembrane component T family protein n=1 Tax=[Mycoplasma] cavipharyngis TaxID=92757 RepID=UPI003704450E